MRFTTGVDLDCTPERAFAWLDDPDRARRWQTNVGDVTILPGTEERVGTTFRETVEGDGRTTELTGEITEYVPGSLIAFHLRGEYNVVDVRYRMSPLGDGSRLDVDANVRFRSFLRLVGPLLRPVFERTIRRQLEEELERLKRSCEEDPSDER